MSSRRRSTRAAPARRDRRGTTIVEMAIVMTVFLTLVLGMLDLGIAVFRYHLLAEASRQGARQAVVHGKLADRLGSWGPAGFSVQADDPSHPLVAAIRPLLVSLELDQVTVQAKWLDGGNDWVQDHRIRVAVRTTYHPVTLFLFGVDIPLHASSTMVVQH